MKTKTAGKLKWAEIALLLALAGFLTSGALALQTEEALSDKVVRLHVLANSDSEEDQALKLKVRDRLLAYVEPLLESAPDRRAAEQSLVHRPEPAEQAPADRGGLDGLSEMGGLCPEVPGPGRPALAGIELERNVR